MFRFASLLCFIAYSTLCTAHTVIVYPPWRGNNIHTNGTVSEHDPDIIPGSLGITFNETTGQRAFPYGMQWMYPCGGMPTSQNRTKWPIKGGAVSIQPGWFPGHAYAQFYINMGYGNEPLNYSHNMVPVFSITGPSNTQYNGTFCLPQVPLPANFTPSVGDNATIQIIETAQHGASLYNCADITFAEPEDVPEVTPENCFNSTTQGENIGFQMVYTTTSSPAVKVVPANGWISVSVPVLLGLASWLSLL